METRNISNDAVYVIFFSKIDETVKLLVELVNTSRICKKLMESEILLYSTKFYAIYHGTVIRVDQIVVK